MKYLDVNEIRDKVPKFLFPSFHWPQPMVQWCKDGQNSSVSHGIGIEKQISSVKQKLTPVDYWDQLISFKYNIDRQSKLTTVEY